MGHQPRRNVNGQTASLWGCKPPEIQLPNCPPIPLFWSQPWPWAQPYWSPRFVRGGMRRDSLPERGRFCWDLIGACLRWDRKKGRREKQHQRRGCKPPGEKGRTPRRGQHAWSLARGRARPWSCGCVGGAGSPWGWQPPRAEDAPGVRAASLPERGCWRVLEHGACQPAPLPFFIRFLLSLQRSGSRCPSPPRASAGLSWPELPGSTGQTGEDALKGCAQFGVRWGGFGV